MSAIPLPEDRLGAFGPGLDARLAGGARAGRSLIGAPGNDALLFRAALAPGTAIAFALSPAPAGERVG
jgi:hypothetical protein